jgi:OOP family OmpA-OmpF porin
MFMLARACVRLCSFVFLLSLQNAVIASQDDNVTYKQIRDFAYIGVKAGSIRYQHGCEPWAISCDKRDTAIAALIGYQLNENFSVEASMFSFGEVDAVYSESGLEKNYIGTVEGWDVGISYNHDLSTNVSGFLKLAALNWVAENQSPDRTIKESDWSPSAEIGFYYQISTQWQARASYQYVDNLGNEYVGSSNGHIAWLGINYQFKAKQARYSAPPAKKEVTTTAASAIVPPAEIETVIVVKSKKASLNFAFDSADVEMTESLRDLINHALKYPSVAVYVKAYTDSVGEVIYNQTLSDRRARSVVNILSDYGIAEDRIFVESFGELSPLNDNATANHRQLNRRVTVTINEFEVRSKDEK